VTRRDVHITLTPYAPGCSALPIRAERRVLSLRSSEAASRSSDGSRA